MENLSENVISVDFAPLAIQEDDSSSEAAGGHSSQRGAAPSDHTFTGECTSQSIAEYLKEMDDLLKCSEEMTCTQEYMSTSTDTQEDISEVLPQCTGFNSREEEAHVSSSMPLTFAGNKLSESLVEYEGQLVDMLDMLQSCEEDSNIDSKPSKYPTDSYEEYVHIPKLFKETTRTPLEPSKAMILEARAAAITLCDHQDHAAGDVYLRKRATRTLPQSDVQCDMSRGSTGHSQEKSSSISNTAQVQDEGQSQSEWAQSEQSMCEKTCTEDHKGSANITDLLNEVKVNMTSLSFGPSDFETLGAKLEECIDEVHCVLQKRRELLAEVTELSGNSQQEETIEIDEQGNHEDAKVAELIMRLKKEEHLKREGSQREIESLRQERAEEERKVWRVSVERQGLHNELWRLKRKLFVIARECAQSHATQEAQQRRMEQLKKEEDELQAAEVQLREDSKQMQQEHRQQLESLQKQLSVATSSLLKNTQEELNQCRRGSCSDVQQYLQDSLKALEERYGPILYALLKRRDTAVEACAKVKEQNQELRVQLTPLREEIQKLTLQKVCLEEKFKLLSFHRKEKMGQYKEIVDSLEESCGELKKELRIQKMKTNDMKELKDILNKKLTTYRSAIENHVNGDKKTA